MLKLEKMSYEEGAMIEPLAVAVHGVKQMGDVTGMNIAVLGAGPIGNLVAQAAKGMGAAKVMITDVSDLRLEKAKECGIDVCVNTKEKELFNELQSMDSEEKNVKAILKFDEYTFLVTDNYICTKNKSNNSIISASVNKN